MCNRFKLCFYMVGESIIEGWSIVRERLETERKEGDVLESKNI